MGRGALIAARRLQRRPERSVRSALICSYYLPQPDLDSSSRRLMHFVDFLLEHGWQVAVAAKNPAGIDRYGRTLRQRGVAVHELSYEAVEELVSSQAFDVALLAFWHIAEPIVNV